MEQQRPKVGIVILTYNTVQLTLDCISTIVEDECEVKLFLVENSPKNLLEERLINEKIEFEYEYYFVENRGYSAGNNIGCHRALDDNCDYILVANNDIIFSLNTISKMIEVFKKDHNVGIVGPAVYLPSGSLQEISMLTQMKLRDAYKYFLRKTPLSFLSKKFVDSFLYQEKKLPKENFPVYAVSGCCFLVSKSCATKIFPFDENVFLYHEEFILGSEMHRAGFLTVYDVGADVVHIGGASTGVDSAGLFAYFVQSEIYYYRQYCEANKASLYPLATIRLIQFYLKKIRNNDNFSFNLFLRMCSKEINRKNVN